MAGAAAKKAAKSSASTASLYFPIIIAVNAFYVAYRVLYRLRTFGLWQAIGLLVTSALYYFCYHGVVDAARLGIPAGPYFDVLVVTLVAQFVSTFSTYGWYIYLLIPGYYASLLGLWMLRQLAAYMNSQSAEDVDREETERELKRHAKKERKAARGPRMKMR